MLSTRPALLLKAKPQVQEVEMLTDVDPNTVLTLAAALADRNSHPVSKSSLRTCRSSRTSKVLKLAEVNDFTALPGQGVVGTIEGTEYYLGQFKKVLDRYLLQSQTIRDKFSALAEKRLLSVGSSQFQEGAGLFRSS